MTLAPRKQETDGSTWNPDLDIGLEGRPACEDMGWWQESREGDGSWLTSLHPRAPLGLGPEPSTGDWFSPERRTYQGFQVFPEPSFLRGNSRSGSCPGPLE